MLALSPPLFSPIGWPLEDPIAHQHNYNYKETETSESLLHFPSIHDHEQPQLGVPCRESAPFGARGSTTGDATMVKKLNHNASERDRRKRINDLYSSLRSLLPAADQKKKLSIPVTVSRVLKYIPELQKEVEGLVRKKEELLSWVCRQEDALISNVEQQGQAAVQNFLSAVSATHVGDGQVVVQISTVKQTKGSLAEVLMSLEEDGLLLLNASSFESFGDRIFYSLHFQVEGTNMMELEVLREKMLSLYGKKEVAICQFSSILGSKVI